MSKSASVLEPEAIAAPVIPASDLCEAEMRESLLKKQKELLELQQKKVEIELLQAKARLQQQQVKYFGVIGPDQKFN
jgi:pre-mRNA cleavage complex 2 protein Pcf11